MNKIDKNNQQASWQIFPKVIEEQKHNVFKKIILQKSRKKTIVSIMMELKSKTETGLLLINRGNPVFNSFNSMIH